SQQPNQDPKPLLINGEWVSGASESFESINPANGNVNYRLSIATQAQVDAAVASAKTAAAQPAWKNMLPHARAQLLMRMADLIMEHGDEFARLQMLENGKVWAECKAQAASAASTFRYYAAVCETQ